jgi:putative Mg2+ transporter-C (MgtC) family protein
MLWHVSRLPPAHSRSQRPGAQADRGVRACVRPLVADRLEREWRQESAGLRTHTLVGVGAALFLIISKYGFSDVLGKHVILDPSRVAAQVVTGIGFIGVVLVYPRITSRLPRSRYVGFGVRVVYADGRGILRPILTQSTRLGFSIDRVATNQHDAGGTAAVAVSLEVRGQPRIEPRTLALSDLDGVLEVTSTDLTLPPD